MIRQKYGFISSLLVLAACLGCGTGEYQNRMAKRADSLQFSGAFESNLRPETVVVNPDVKLRLPGIFDSNSTGNPSAASPAICNLPGLNMTYERFMTEGDKALPFYCYFASSPIGPNQKPEDFKAQIEAEVAKAGAAGGKFSSISLSGPSGGSQSWDMLSVTSTQNFAGKSPAPDASMEGRFDLYFRSTGKDFVLVGWRAPKTAAAASKFFDDAKLAMGSAQVTETAPATPPTGGPPGGS